MRDNLFAFVTMKKGTKYILVKKKKYIISFTYTTMRKNKRYFSFSAADGVCEGKGGGLGPRPKALLLRC